MTPSIAAPAALRSDWRAQLELSFDTSSQGTRLALRRHSGPLVVQGKNDVLAIDVEAGAGAHALLTTPGAGKLYKSAGRVASQEVRLAARQSAVIEWLPQESIVFDGAEVSLGLDVDVEPGALVAAWEIVTLGREAMGERFVAGRLRTRLRVRMGDQLALWEAGDLDGGGEWLASPAGWRNARTCGTFVVAGRPVPDELLDACRDALTRRNGTSAVSRLGPSLLVARFLGPSAREARAAFVDLWERIRPALTGRGATPPRIWAT